jgi:hypothetical protein
MIFQTKYEQEGLNFSLDSSRNIGFLHKLSNYNSCHICRAEFFFFSSLQIHDQRLRILHRSQKKSWSTILIRVSSGQTPESPSMLRKNIPSIRLRFLTNSLVKQK